MSDDLILFGEGLDQSVPDNNGEWVFRKVNQVIQRAVREKNPEIALEACRELVVVTKISGKALARILYMLFSYWEDFNATDDFWDTVYIRVGLSRHTVERYVRVGALLTENIVPPQFLPKLEERNIGEIIPIANAIAQGYDLQDSQWQEILQQPDATSIRQKIREFKMEAPRRYGLQIFMDSEGSLWCQTVDSAAEFIGYLNIDDQSRNVQRAISRIVDHSGVMRK